MKRWLYAYRFVHGHPAPLERALLDNAHGLLRFATASDDQEPAVDGSVYLAIESTIAGIDLAKHVRVKTGVAYRSGPRTALPITWHALPAKALFPAFEGILELEPMSDWMSQFTLTGSYIVPLGPLGAAVESMLLGQVAHRTADHLVAAMARELQRLAASEAPPTEPSGPRRGEPLRVSDVMTSNPIAIDADVSLRTAALILFHNDISGAPVVSARGELVGIISERDLLSKEALERPGFGKRAGDEVRRREATTVGQACTAPVRTTVPDVQLAAAAREMLDHDVSRLPVIDRGRIAGIISRHDVLAALVRDDTEIEAAVQRALELAGAPELSIEVEWGQVRLAGVTHLRSVAAQAARVAKRVDGVMAVDDTAVSWVEDDIVAVSSLPYA